MIKKLTPLIVLIMFAIGAYFMMQGMDKAVDMTKPKKDMLPDITRSLPPK